MQVIGALARWNRRRSLRAGPAGLPRLNSTIHTLLVPCAGHVLPGCVFIIWGAWWSWCILTSYICHRESGRPYRSRAWFPLRLPGRVRRSLWFLEPALKIAVPAVGVSLELLLDHDPVEYR